MAVRSFSVVALILTISPLASAQTTDSTRLETLVGQHRRIGGYVGLETRVTRVKATGGSMAGGDIALLLGRRLSIGVAGFGWTSSEITRPATTGGGAETLRLGYGGLEVGYTLRPTSIVHGTVELLMAGGGAHWSGADDDASDRADAFLVLEPAIGIQANVARFLRASLAVTYRHAAGVSLVDLRDRDVRGMSVRLALRAGQF